jgi:hypothetical protein
MRASFGRKNRGNSYGKKSSKLIKGVKGLGMALVAGAGIYAAVNSTDKEHKHHEEEQERKQSLNQQLDENREKLAAEGAKPAPAPAGEFGKSGSGGKLDKAEDVLAVAGEAIDAARDVDEATGKFGKAKAVAKGAKRVKDKTKEIGKKDKQAKFEAGELTEKQAKKFAGKQMKKAEKEARIRLCDGKYPKGTGKKTAAKRELCYKTGN